MKDSILNVPVVSVVGLGYVGLVTALSLASNNVHTIGLDIDSKKISALERNKISIHEPGLEELLNKSRKIDSIEFTTHYSYAISNSDLTIICVDTPIDTSGRMNLTNLKKSTIRIAKEISSKTKHTVIVRSTVLPGTCDNILKPILNKVQDRHVLLYNPEFLREGYALQDTINPDRIIIGSNNDESGKILLSLYKKIIKGSMPPVLKTTFVNAEFIKCASNAFLALKISFANTISDLCESVSNCDIGKVMEGVGLDRRIGRQFLNAGVGFGGSCLPKDLNALVSYSKSLGKPSTLLGSTMSVNKERPYILVKKAKEKLGSLKGKKVAVLGLSFKPNTDDIRHAPSLTIIRELLKNGANVTVYDPKAMERVRKIHQDFIIYANSPKECVTGSDCCMIVTEWDIFRKTSINQLAKLMNKPIVLDGRRMFPYSKINDGVDYYCIGQGSTFN